MTTTTTMAMTNDDGDDDYDIVIFSPAYLSPQDMLAQLRAHPAIPRCAMAAAC